MFREIHYLSFTVTQRLELWYLLSMDKGKGDKNGRAKGHLLLLEESPCFWNKAEDAFYQHVILHDSDFGKHSQLGEDCLGSLCSLYCPVKDTRKYGCELHEAEDLAPDLHSEEWLKLLYNAPFFMGQASVAQKAPY